MARLALLTPWPPQPSGIATCAADLVPALAAAGHAIDVLVDEALVAVDRGPDGPPAPGHVRVLGAHELVWRMARGHYDLPVYQIGNSWAHGFIWPYLFRYPGLTVMHDARLHHARATTLLSRGRADDYRAEFRYNHPRVNPDAAELAVAGFDGVYYYHWPMRRAVIEASRIVASHSRSMVTRLARKFPHRAVEYIALGHGRDRSAAELADARRRFRAAHNIHEDAVLLGIMGSLAPERRIAQVVRAFAAARTWAPDAQLLLCGRRAPLLPLDDILRSFGVRTCTHVVSDLPDDQFDDAVASLDVGLNLRWPTAREMSGPWLRMLAAGLPTVVLDAVQHNDVTMLDPRTWRCPEPLRTLDPRPEADAVAVAIDVLDEDHSLRLALRRLISDAPFRQTVGDNARRYWRHTHTLTHMVTDYERVIALAQSAAPPATPLPPHLQPDVWAHTRHVLWDGAVDPWRHGPITPMDRTANDR